MKAVQFGAGNIGRGFIAQLFYESGFETVFVEADNRLVEALNRNRAYTVHIVGPGAQDISIRNVRAVDGRESEQVARELANCDIACTAVGVNALPFVAANLAGRLSLRYVN